MSNHSKSISALYYAATGQTLREQDIAEVSKFANVVRAAVEKDVRAELARSTPSPANGAVGEMPEPEPTMIGGRFYYTATQLRAAVLAERAEIVAILENRSEGWESARPKKDEHENMCQFGAKHEARALAEAIRART